MDDFLDTNIIIGYASFSKGSQANSKDKKGINKKCYEIIVQNRSSRRIIVCFYVLDYELPRVRRKMKAIRMEVIKKLEDEKYEIGNSDSAIKHLLREDINKAKALYNSLINDKSLPRMEDKLNNIYLTGSEFESRIDYFLRHSISEKTIPIEKIDPNLYDAIVGILMHINDSKILASALMHQQNKETFFFTTTDKEHFNPYGFEFIKEDPRLKKSKFPELRNLYFEE